MNDSTKKLVCPACSANEATLLFSSHNGYAIVRCTSCSLVYTDMREAPAASTLYPAFEQSDSGLPKALQRSLAVFARQREAIVRRVKRNGRVLDFGCGSGSFARYLSGRGYDVVGLEPFSLGRPLEEDRLLLLREPLESAAPKLGQFDVITMWHVLEHLSRPIDVLRRLSNLLAPDGVLIVSVPNFQSWQSRVFRGGWFHLDPPRHVIHFESDTLAKCLQRASFEVMDRWEFLPEYGSSGWLQSTLNRLLPHDNYLYEVVKDRGAVKDLSLGTHGLHLSVSLLLSAPMVALSTPVEAVASALHRGAALTFAARKNAFASTD
jgi:SAM-dependent methyltransferase